LQPTITNDRNGEQAKNRLADREQHHPSGFFIITASEFAQAQKTEEDDLAVGNSSSRKVFSLSSSILYVSVTRMRVVGGKYVSLPRYYPQTPRRAGSAVSALYHTTQTALHCARLYGGETAGIA
jgi:hypothetical protein